MNIYLRTLQAFKIHLGNKKFCFILLFGVLTSLLVLSETYMASRIVGLIEQYLKSGNITFRVVLLFSLQWAIIIFLSISFQYIYRYYFVDKNILDFYVSNLKTTSSKALNIPYGIYLQKRSGEIFKKIERGREGFMNFLFFFYLNIVKDLSGLLVAVFVMFYININMALIVVSGIPIAIFIGIFFNKKTLLLQNENNRKEDIVFGMIGDSISNFGLFKILTLENHIIKRFHNTENELLKIQNNISKRWAVANIYTSSLIAILRIIVLLGGFYFITIGSISFSELFLYFFLIGWIYYPLGAIFGHIRQIQRWASGIGDFFEEFEDNYKNEDLHIGKTLKTTSGNIEFKNVSFGYSEEKKILQNIDLKIEKGQQIALVGNTGAGKSTLVNLLLRFWDVNSGEILLDGNNINDLKKSSLRSHIGVVSQDNSLFNLSIEENLKFANPKATKKQVEEALKNAEAQFVFDLKDGIKTVIGERGLKLSGGEKQRISIARLFLKNPEILVLDEATSALDNTTEKKIEKALKKLMKGKTSIIIAHRLSTIQHADRICVLEYGKIVETGNYEELMKQKGKFYSLANPDKLILG